MERRAQESLFWKRVNWMLWMHFVAVFAGCAMFWLSPVRVLSLSKLREFLFSSPSFAKAAPVWLLLIGGFIWMLLAAGDPVALLLVRRISQRRRTDRLLLSYVLAVGIIVACHIAATVVMVRLGQTRYAQMSFVVNEQLLTVTVMVDLMLAAPAGAVLVGRIKYPPANQEGFPVGEQ